MKHPKQLPAPIACWDFDDRTLATLIGTADDEPRTNLDARLTTGDPVALDRWLGKQARGGSR